MAQPRIRRSLVFALLALYAQPVESLALYNAKSGTKLVVIQVCQNKDCCQRFQGKALTLVETMQCLGSKFQIESSGCLSQCGKGPNVLINKEVHHHQVENVHSAAAILDMADDATPIHPTLVAAIKVLERAHQGMFAYYESC